MNRFKLVREGDEVAEISIEGNKIKVVPKNILKNLSLLPSTGNFSGILKAIAKSGYEVEVEKGPFKIRLK